MGEKEKIQVEVELTEPLNKLCALSQLFDAVDDNCLKMDISGLLGISAILNGTVEEIIRISEGLNKRIQMESMQQQAA